MCVYLNNPVVVLVVGEGGGCLKEGGTKPKARISKDPAIPWVEWESRKPE